MDLDSAINEFGGKAGQLYALKDAIPDLPIPKFVMLKDGQQFYTIKSALQGMRPPFILRCSNKDDHFGLAGILPTYPNLTSVACVEQCIGITANEIRNPAYLPAYEELYGPVDRKTHLMVMEQNPSKVFAVAMRHPHEPEFLWVEAINRPTSSMVRQARAFQINTLTGEYVLSKAHDPSPFDKIKMIFRGEGVKDLSNLPDMVRVIESVEKSSAVTPGYALQFEFGLDPLALFQVRPFKPFEAPRFQFDPQDPRVKDLTCFGQTPPEGVELYVPDKEYGSGSEKFNPQTKKDWLIQLQSNWLPRGVFLDALYSHAYAISLEVEAPAILSHDSFRLMKQADVTCTGLGHHLIRMRGDPMRVERVKFWSNGLAWKLERL